MRHAESVMHLTLGEQQTMGRGEALLTYSEKEAFLQDKSLVIRLEGDSYALTPGNWKYPFAGQD